MELLTGKEAGAASSAISEQVADVLLVVEEGKGNPLKVNK